MKHITGRTDLPTYDEDNVVYEIIEDLLMKVSDLHFADVSCIFGTEKAISYQNHIVSESIPNVSTDISQSNLSFHDLATSSVSSSNVDSEKTIKEAKNMSEPLERQEACASKDTFLVGFQLSVLSLFRPVSFNSEETFAELLCSRKMAPALSLPL